MNYPAWLPKWLVVLWESGVILFQTDLTFRIIVLAFVGAIALLPIYLIVEEDRKYRAFRKRLETRIAKEEAKRGIKPVVALPWYYNSAVSGLIAGLSEILGFLGRISDFFKRLGNSLLGLIKKGLGGIPTFMKSRAILFVSAGKKWRLGQWRERLLPTAQMAGYVALLFLAGLGFVLLAVLYALFWLLELIPTAISWAFLATSGWLGTRAVAIEAKLTKWEEIRELRQKPELAPVGIVFYHAVENSARTGKLYKGFLPKEAVEDKENPAAALPTKLILLINGTGYWLEKPERLRRHTKLVDVPAGPGGETRKEEITLYDEAKTFRELSGAGTLFDWRLSNWRLLDSGNCEVELHGIHPHFRSVSLVPFETVRYWLATMAAEEGESKEGPNEVLLVEEILGSWGEHQGLLRMFAWTGIELPQGEVEEARMFLSTINPKEIKPAVPAFAE